MSHSGVLALSANSPVIYHRQDFLSLRSIQSRSWTASYLGCRSIDCLFRSWTIYTLLGMFDFWKLPEISIHNRLKFAHLIPCCLSNKEESTRYSSRSFFSYRRNQRLLSKENIWVELIVQLTFNDSKQNPKQTKKMIFTPGFYASTVILLHPISTNYQNVWRQSMKYRRKFSSFMNQV